ncbi:hypothetical protein ACHHYP_15969 [Achlya hypogyna]|uniref:Fibrous sheath-interacting protein 1 n=1 Tax=Achlya hypogyna TaxID=1202772 RepID=A0A1V9Y9U5_ACHHY|nr:hypothetical protein ACHHYP_15969 [Achlya hypogyna]
MELRPRSSGSAAPSPASSPMSRVTGRPNTTPKLRIQKMLSLPQKTQAAAADSAPEVFFMTNLPDSPPKPACRAPLAPEIDRVVEAERESSAGSDSDDTDEVDATDAVSDELTQVTTPTIASRPKPAPVDVAAQYSGTAFLEEEEEVSSESFHEQQLTPETQGCQDDDANQAEESPSVDGTDRSSGAEEVAAEECGGYYAQWKQQMESAEAARAALESDLQQYVASLHTKADDSGDSLVAFPDNYNDVVALMTGKDIQDTSPSTWSKALLQDGLMRTQPFGALLGEDAPPELTVKIARGIAAIRMNDLILDKLNIKLKGAQPVSTKTFLTQPTPMRRTSSAQRIKDKVEAAKSMEAARGVDFVARNKEVKGAGKSLTKAEEARVDQLLEGSPDGIDADLPLPVASVAFVAPTEDEARLETLDATLQTMLRRRKEDPVAVLHGPVEIPPAWATSGDRYKQDRLAAIEATLQAFRDEDNGTIDDDCISFRSGVSRRTSISSAATSTSSRTVTKRQLHQITSEARDEIDEKAPPVAIQQLLASLAGITIDIIDDDDDASVTFETSSEVDEPSVLPHKPATLQAPVGRRKRPPVRAEGPSAAAVVKASSFAHLFTLPFEPQGPAPRRVMATASHR